MMDSCVFLWSVYPHYRTCPVCWIRLPLWTLSFAKQATYRATYFLTAASNFISLYILIWNTSTARFGHSSNDTVLSDNVKRNGIDCDDIRIEDPE